MAISPEQITQERDAAFQQKVDACESEIDAHLKSNWGKDYPKKQTVEITDILFKHRGVFDAVMARYKAAGWDIVRTPSDERYQAISYALRREIK